MHKINIVEAERIKMIYLNNIVKFNNKFRPRSKEGNDKKKYL